MDYKGKKDEWNECYNEASAYWAPFLTEAELDLRAHMGDPWSSADKIWLKTQGREAKVFNKIQRVNRLISGFQRKNRLSMKIGPVEDSDEKTASQLSGIIQHIMNNKAYHTMSEAFEGGTLKTGINLINIYLDTSEDMIDGDIRLKRIPYNKFLLSPYFSERDLSDCSYLLRREYLSQNEVKVLLPMKMKEIEQLGASGDNKFSFFAPPTQNSRGSLLAYDEFWQLDYKEVKQIIDPVSGAVSEWRGTKEQLKEVQIDFPKAKVVPLMKRTVHLTILVNGEVFWSGDDPNGIGEYPYVPIMGFWQPEYDESEYKLQALTRCMRDPQDDFNKRRSQVKDLIESQISSGYKVEEGSVVNPKSLFQAGQGKVVWAKKGQLDKIQQLNMGDIPPGLFQIMDILDRDIVEIPGGTDELLGTPQNANTPVAGVLGKLRQAAGLVGLQDIFDNYRLAKTFVGNKIIKMVQKNYSPEKVKRILNEEPAPEFYKESFGRYDCTVQEGVLTDSQREMYYAELVELKDKGAPIPWTAILEVAPLQHKDRLLEQMKQAEAGAAEEAKFDKLMERLTAALMQSETMSNVEGARAKTAKAMEDKADAALTRIKTMREVGQIDDKNFMETLKLILEIEKMGSQPAPTPAAPGTQPKTTGR